MSYPKDIYDRLPDCTTFVRRMGHRISIGDWVEKRKVVIARCHDANCNRSFFLALNNRFHGQPVILAMYEGTDTYTTNHWNNVITFGINEKIPFFSSIENKFFCKRYQILI